MDVSALEITVLEIVDSARTVHTLSVLNQMGNLSKVTNTQVVSEAEIRKALASLVEKGLIKYLENLDSYKITDEGKDVI